MPGRGLPPKPEHLRQRKNKDHVTAQLGSEESALGNIVPDLPARPGVTSPREKAEGGKKLSPSVRGYGVAHQKWRAEVLAKNPKCVDCGQLAAEADHIVPLSKGGEALSIENGTGRCKPCHAAKTARDQKLYGSPVQSDWHPMVVEWWQSVWRSPMASEYLDSDMRGGLYILADLHQARWTATDPAVLVKVSAEIRLQEVRFGLSPIDRSRLRWTIAHSDEAVEKSEARKETKTSKVSKGKDPRSVLQIA